MPATLIIKRLDNTQAPKLETRWLRGEIVLVVEDPSTLGTMEQASAGLFLLFTVTDRTVEEMNTYLEPYVRPIDMTVIAGPDPSGRRRIEVKNLNANRTGAEYRGRGYWTTEQTTNIEEEWNLRYPEANLVTVEFPNDDPPYGLGNIWTCEGTFTTGQALEFNDVVVDQGSITMDKRKVWQVSEAFCQNIEANGGSQSGTSSQLAPHLRDTRET